MTRIHSLQALLIKKNLCALIIDNPIDLYYLTAQQLSLGRLVLEPYCATLFVDGRYFAACQAACTEEISVKLTEDYSSTSAFGAWWHLQKQPVGFDADFTSYTAYEALKGLGSTLEPLHTPLKPMRTVKEPEELEALQAAATLGSLGFDYALSLLKEGITEKELAAAIEIFWLQNGGDRPAFPPHIAFGKNSAEPHHHSNDTPLKKGDLVLIDIGVVRDNYHSDMTRVLFFSEPIHPELLKIYSIVHEAFQAAQALCHPGIKSAELDLAARNLIAEKGYGEYFSHALGHGVGLQIHESPRIFFKGKESDHILKEGMVLTIEPGIYLPGIGGVRLEDTFVVTKEGCCTLTHRPFWHL